MSIVPDGWGHATVRDVCLPVSKVDPASLNRSHFQYVDIGSIETGAMAVSSPQVIAVQDAPSRARQLVAVGDTVFSTVRPYLKKIAWISENLDGEIASTGFCVLRPNREHVDPRFLFHYAASDGLLNQVLPLQRGVSYPAVRDGDVLSAKVPVPPLDEQRRIVALLEYHLSRLEAAMASIQAVVRLSTRLVDAQRRLLLYPEGVRTVPIATVASVVNGSTPKGIADATVAVGGPGRIPYIKVGDMNSGDGIHVVSSRTWLREEDARRLGMRVAPAGTVIFPKRGGAIATNKKRVLARAAAFDLNTMGVIPGTDLEPAFLRMYFESVDLTSIADGSNIPQINAKGMARLRVPVLDLAAQREAVASLEGIEAAVTRYATAPTMDLASRLRRSLLRAAFSGQLTKESVSV